MISKESIIKGTMKNPEWNSVFGDEDLKALNSSEVFREYFKLYSNKEGAFKEEEDEEDVGVKQPIKRNKDYDYEKNAEEYIKDLIINAQEFAEGIGIEDEVYDESIDVIDKHYEDYNDLYNTGAGESKYINTGLTEQTMKEIESRDAIKKVMDIYKGKEESAPIEYDYSKEEYTLGEEE